MKKIFLFFLLFLIYTINAQEKSEAIYHHEHHENEIGIGNAPVLFLNEKEIAYGLHIHYVRMVDGSKFSYGLGYERVFDDHKHNTLGFVVGYTIFNRLNLNFTPGFSFEDHSDEYSWAVHIESSYDFELDDFHIGPNIEFAADKEDYHFSIGLHLGFGF